MANCICMVSDFFYPNMGGVEEHIFNLSQCLIKRDYKVIVVTHSYTDRVGIRYMTCGLKIYYLPIKVFYNQCVLPTKIANIPLIRNIFIRERVDIVHTHSAFSAFGHEVALIARLMGLKTIFTDHSLFGFADMSAVVMNKFLELALADINHCICVSHTGKENTVLRAKVPCDKVSVIPNAVDANAFTPDPSKRDPNKITIVIVSRLVYRKGVDLMAAVMAEICPRYPNVNFIVGGDGPKMWLLQQVRERQGLQDQITLLGALKHSEVKGVLNKGHIFLNTSLTEAYCMAIVEATSCGLQIVSTKVGGIPEVLPETLIYLTEPNVDSLVNGLEKAMTDLKSGKNMCPYQCNNLVKKMYNWVNIAQRTEIVYKRVLKEPSKCLGEQLKSYLPCGVWPYLLVVSLVYLILQFMEWYIPRSLIDIARDITGKGASRNQYKTNKNRCR